MRREITIAISLWLMSGGLVFGLPQVSSESPRARIVGRVLSTEGKPLSHAIVTAQKPGGSALFQAKTDRSGRYAMDVEPGRYIIRAEKGGYVTSEYRVEEASFEPTPMMVEAGKSVTVDLQLPRGGVITGRIVDEDGEPVVGATVQVERRQEEPSRGAPWVFGLRGPATTDDRGIYRIYGLASGRYYVSARVREAQAVRISSGTSLLMPQEGAVTYYPGVSSRERAVEVEVVEGAETTGIDFKIVPEKERGIVCGVVRKRETGEPVPRIIIIAYSTERPSIDARATTDEQGHYELKGLAPGTYRVQVTSGMLLQEEDYAQPPTQEVTIENDPVEVNFELERAAEISGRIVTEDWRVPENVTRLFPLLYPKGAERRGVGAMPRVDAQGNFTIKRVPSGAFLLDLSLRFPLFLACCPSRRSGCDDGGARRAPRARVTDVVILLANAGAVLRGRVLSSEGDVPLPNAVVQRIPVDFALRFAERGTMGTRSIVSDQHGGYEIKGIPPGRYYLLVLQQRPMFRRQEEFIEFLSARAAQLPLLEFKAREAKQLDVRPMVRKYADVDASTAETSTSQPSWAREFDGATGEHGGRGEAAQGLVQLRDVLAEESVHAPNLLVELFAQLSQITPLRGRWRGIRTVNGEEEASEALHKTQSRHRRRHVLRTRQLVLQGFHLLEVLRERSAEVSGHLSEPIAHRPFDLLPLIPNAIERPQASSYYQRECCGWSSA